MIQLELCDDDSEQMALLCDRCGRAWFRTAGVDPDGLRDAAVNKGWQISGVADRCPRCVRTGEGAK